jgi:hypothetical protein
MDQDRREFIILLYFFLRYDNANFDAFFDALMYSMTLGPSQTIFWRYTQEVVTDPACTPKKLLHIYSANSLFCLDRGKKYSQALLDL